MINEVMFTVAMILLEPINYDWVGPYISRSISKIWKRNE